MDVDDVWRAIDAERASTADLLETLTPAEWEAPSLCEGWRVRDVAAHLTLDHMGPFAATAALVRAGGRFDRMVRDTALRRARLPVEQLPRRLRDMVGSRRKVVGLTPLEPLINVLVHGQDITRPLGRIRPMPPDAATAAAARVWTMGWPFHARKRLQGLRLTATDTEWSAGQGASVEGPVAALLLLVTGRNAALSELSGDGTHELAARMRRAEGTRRSS